MDGLTGLRIEILAAPRSIGFTDKDTGEQRTFQVQEAALHTPGQKYPKTFEIAVPRNQKPWPLGMYELQADSVYVNRMGKLSLQPRLKPIMASASHVGQAAKG